ncbi:MAG: glycosyltransferase [Symbiobacteriaceae bacterium]|nr:glycosyltransferase [Symbiobacteriaceae bacterium]
MRISVIIPVYNIAPYLPQCVESIIASPFKELEVILVDDGSTDESPSICDAYEAADPRVVVIHQANGGLSAARNSGIRQATGEYLLFVDGDDWVAGEVIPELAALVAPQSSPPDVIFLEAVKQYPEGNQVPMGDGYQAHLITGRDKATVMAHLAQLPKFPGSACSKMVRRQVILEHNLFFTPDIYCEDIDWSLSLFQVAASFGYNPTPFYYYRQNRPGSITSQKGSKRLQNLLDVIAKHSLPTAANSSHRREHLAFLAYEYMVLLLLYAKLPRLEKRQYTGRLNGLHWLLRYGQSPKLQLVFWFTHLLGINFTAYLLNLYYTLREGSFAATINTAPSLKLPPPRALYVATVSRHIAAFHIPYLQWLKEQGYETHVVTGDAGELSYVDKHHQIPMARSPLAVGNLTAVFKLRRLLKQNKYTIIHCHTPVGGVVTRLAAVGLSQRGKLFYTAHGFHFYKGAPWVNWLFFFPVEFILARFTDCLITINREDYQTAKKFRFPAQKIVCIPGVGVDMAKFAPLSREEKAVRREKYGYTAEERLLFFAAEFSWRKNHELLIQGFARYCFKHPSNSVRLLLAGDVTGDTYAKCQQLTEKLGIPHKVSFLGYRNDLAELLPCLDMAISSSRQEGLPVNIMEALSCGLPVIVSRVRGHTDLVRHGKNGYLVKLNSKAPLGYAQAIEALLKDIDARGEALAVNCRRSVRQYGQEKVVAQVVGLYPET